MFYKVVRQMGNMHTGRIVRMRLELEPETAGEGERGHVKAQWKPSPLVLLQDHGSLHSSLGHCCSCTQLC